MYLIPQILILYTSVGFGIFYSGVVYRGREYSFSQTTGTLLFPAPFLWCDPFTFSISLSVLSPTFSIRSFQSTHRVTCDLFRLWNVAICFHSFCHVCGRELLLLLYDWSQNNYSLLFNILCILNVALWYRYFQYEAKRNARSRVSTDPRLWRRSLRYASFDHSPSTPPFLPSSYLLTPSSPPPHSRPTTYVSSSSLVIVSFSSWSSLLFSHLSFLACVSSMICWEDCIIHDFLVTWL